MTTRTLIGKYVMAIGIIMIGIATITGIGYGLYLWAHTATFAMAAWTGFFFG